MFIASWQNIIEIDKKFKYFAVALTSDGKENEELNVQRGKV